MNSIISIDLVAAARKSSEVPKQYSEALLIEAASRYEKFLLLVKDHLGKGLSPSKDIDMMWHLHMLHPQAYYNDCMQIFGKILDHNGGFGSVPEEVEPLAKAFALTSGLWEDKYGDPYVTPGRVGGRSNGEHLIRQCRSVCTEQCSTNCH